MPRTEVKNEVFEGLTNKDILFPNFKGVPDPPYNSRGDQIFNIRLDPERAEDLDQKGWHVKTWVSSDEDTVYFLPVRINFDGPRPPKCYQMGGELLSDGSVNIKNKTKLDKEMVKEWQETEFYNLDIIVSPSLWEMNGKTGIKAYAKAMYATVVLDPLQIKYANVGQNDIYNEDLDEEVPFN